MNERYRQLASYACRRWCYREPMPPLRLDQKQRQAPSGLSGRADD